MNFFKLLFNNLFKLVFRFPFVFQRQIAQNDGEIVWRGVLLIVVPVILAILVPHEMHEQHLDDHVDQGQVLGGLRDFFSEIGISEAHQGVVQTDFTVFGIC